MGTPHRILETPLYHFDQLSDKAKQVALDKYRESQVDHDWWDAVYEDAETMAGYLGITIDTRKQGHRQVAIYFSGFSSQGDGACFEGSYAYRKNGLRELKSAAPAGYKDKETGKWVVQEGNTELHRICKGLQDVQRKYFYKLEAVVKQRGHYQHSGCTSIEVTHADSMYRDIGDAEDDIAQLLRDFMDWIYSQLEKEYDYLTSDEAVKESIESNELEFDEQGNCV